MTVTKARKILLANLPYGRRYFTISCEFLHTDSANETARWMVYVDALDQTADQNAFHKTPTLAASVGMVLADLAAKYPKKASALSEAAASIDEQLNDLPGDAPDEPRVSGEETDEDIQRCRHEF